MAPAIKGTAGPANPLVDFGHVLLDDFHLVKHHLGDFWHTIEHDVHDAVEAFTHAEAKKKAAAEAARDAAAAPKAAKAKAKAPAASPAGAVVLHAEKAWPPTAWPRAVRMLVAGALGGAVSKTATAPIETVRLNVMVGTGGKTVTEVIGATFKNSGAAGFFKGNLLNVIRTIPSKSIQFWAFDIYKKALSKPNPSTGKMEASPLAVTLAGSLAGVTSTVACHPLETIQTRLACSAPGMYKGVGDMVVKVVRKEGPKALFGGLGPSLVGIIPFSGAQFFVYDGLRWSYQQATKQQTVPKTVALCAGSIAGVTAATVSFPLEVVRRRMMMGQKYKNTLDALLVISRTEGVGALFSGCTLNWIKVIPSTGIQLYTYEFAKELLQVQQ